VLSVFYDRSCEYVTVALHVLQSECLPVSQNAQICPHKIRNRHSCFDHNKRLGLANRPELQALKPSFYPINLGGLIRRKAGRANEEEWIDGAEDEVREQFKGEGTRAERLWRVEDRTGANAFTLCNAILRIYDIAVPTAQSRAESRSDACEPSFTNYHSASTLETCLEALFKKPHDEGRRRRPPLALPLKPRDPSEGLPLLRTHHTLRSLLPVRPPHDTVHRRDAYVRRLRGTPLYAKASMQDPALSARRRMHACTISLRLLRRPSQGHR
jgi:hypothetical protein